MPKSCIPVGRRQCWRWRTVDRELSELLFPGIRYLQHDRGLFVSAKIEAPRKNKTKQWYGEGSGEWCHFHELMVVQMFDIQLIDFTFMALK